jgi:CHAT domain-containing protein
MLYAYKTKPDILSRALNYRLATKAMLLNNSGHIRSAILASKDPQLVDTYLKWKSQKDYLVKLYSLGKRELALMKVNPDSVERSVNDLEKQLSLKTNLLSKGFNHNVSWKDVQKALKPDEAAVEIIRTYSPNVDEMDKVFYMALIIDKNTKDYPKMALMEDGYEMETQYCKQYRDAIFDTTKKENTYQHFWEKIEKELNGVKKIYFSTDGIYPKINLNSIKNPTTKKYLIDDYDFYFVSSLRDLIDKKEEVKNIAAERSITLFGFPDYTSAVTAGTPEEGQVSAEYLLERKNDNLDRSFHLDPLPGTKKEVEEIAKMMKSSGWKTDLFLAKEAQEQKLKSLQNPTVLHIATHGYFQKDVDKSIGPATSKLGEKMTKNPLLCSGLMMAGASNAYNVNYANATNWAGTEDGILTAFEAMNLNLDKTELVVLSACETGLGEIHNGEGVYGLQRAFMVAGAKTVIMSLWTVSDAATQKLMTLFYTKWLETGDKHGAFRYAQLELKKTFPDPYFWSAFVMIGN